MRRKVEEKMMNMINCGSCSRVRENYNTCRQEKKKRNTPLNQPTESNKRTEIHPTEDPTEIHPTEDPTEIHPTEEPNIREEITCRAP